MSAALQALHKLLVDIAEKNQRPHHHLHIRAVKTGVHRATSLYLAVISAPKKSILHLFAKVAKVYKNLRCPSPFKLFDIERFFYTNIAILYQKLQDTYQVPFENRMKFAEFYGCNTNSSHVTIVIENLGAQGFYNYDIRNPVDWNYASQAVEELAKFHALSMALEENQPDLFEKIANGLSFPKDNRINIYWGDFVRISLNAMNDEFRERAQRFLVKMYDNGGFNLLKKMFRRPVLIHLDFRPSNLMYRYRHDGRLDFRVVDYQTLEVGCAVIDLLYFIVSSTDEGFRRIYYFKLIEHYYLQIRLALKRLNVDPDIYYPLADFHYELNYMTPYTLLIAMLALPAMIMETTDAEQVSCEMDIFSFMIQKTNDQLRDRLNGIMRDLIMSRVL